VESVAEQKVKTPLVDEDVIDEGEVPIRLSGIDDPWPYVVTTGKYPISHFPSGRVLIGVDLPKHPDAGLVWTQFPDEGQRIHQIWVADDLRRAGVARQLVGLYRKHWGTPLFIGPFSPSGEAFVASIGGQTNKLKARLLR